MGSAGQGQGPIVLRHYELQKQLGRGAMGSVWGGIDRRDGSRVAVKLLHPHLGADPEFRARFEREAHVAALLRSPYTVHLLDYGVSEGTCYIVMEFVDGHPASEEMANGAVETARALRIATEIARALEEAGARGVVHRDIKPENVMIDVDDRVKVTDFGIARQATSAGMTTTGIFVGTPAYAAPEQADGEVDQRTDIYALGATLFALLSGRPPYRGASVIEILQHHRYSPLPMSELSHLPDAIVNVVRRCMEKDPRDRYQSASELVGALERASLNYAQFVKQGGGGSPSTYEAPRPTPSTIPVPPPTRPSPQQRAPAPPPSSTHDPTRLESRARPAAPQAAATPAPVAGSGIRIELAEKAKPNRDGLGRYALSVVNETGALVRLRLVPTDASGVLQVNVPGRVAVPPGTTVLLDVTAQPRVRRTRGPDRHLSFGVTAVDEATGATAGADTSSYPDIVGGGGNGRILAIAVVAGVIAVVGALLAALFLFDGDDDDTGGQPGTPTSGSGATTDTRPSIAPGTFDYALTGEANDCDFGLRPGGSFARSFIFAPTGGRDALIEGEQASITGVEANGDEVAIGRAPFALTGFTFTYEVVSDDAPGTATMITSFNADGSIASATVTETYDLGDTTCTITASQ